MFIDPVAFRIGPIAIHWYGIIFAVAAVAAAWLATREARRRGEDSDRVWTMLLVAAVGGIIGSRIYHVIHEWDFYSQNLAVPARREPDDPEALKGKELFYEIGCAACHRPKFMTGEVSGQPYLSHQLIWPYTDMLLHDMGEGLADGRPEGAASGREWRTPPLWGIGLTETVSGHTLFLHDGRARNLTEAILWHGGEAKAARDKFATLSKADRDALLAFVNSL